VNVRDVVLLAQALKEHQSNADYVYLKEETAKPLIELYARCDAPYAGPETEVEYERLCERRKLPAITAVEVGLVSELVRLSEVRMADAIVAFAYPPKADDPEVAAPAPAPAATPTLEDF
jgi:hypothetical protein